MSRRKKQQIELLSPAGNSEKLEIAVCYGADAVYLGGKDFSLRNFSGNFTCEEMREGVDFAHKHGVKVYVACNIYPRNHEQTAVADYLRKLGDIRPDALIIADPGIFTDARRILPEMPLHLSTQANTTNYNSVLFWEKLGITRVNMARELSLDEIRDIAEHTSVEMEAFVHGSMCISYSGRCLLSSFMAGRESNRGMCCHPCRFSYAVMEEKRPGEYFPIMEDGRGSYVFNSKDLCMIEHIPEIIKAGITSLKIEGRMKGISYLASVTKVYREAIDLYYADPAKYGIRDYWLEELARVNHRGSCTGFYFGNPDETALNYKESGYWGEHVFLGKVCGTAGEGSIWTDVRNKILKGEKVDVLRKKGPAKKATVLEIRDEDGFPLSVAKPNTRVMLRLGIECSQNDIVRRIGN